MARHKIAPMVANKSEANKEKKNSSQLIPLLPIPSKGGLLPPWWRRRGDGPAPRPLIQRGTVLRVDYSFLR